MPKLRDMPRDRPPNILLYGGVGCGKTALALTLGEGCQVLDLDDGLLSGVYIEDDFQEARMSVDVKQFLEPKPDQIALAFSKCKSAVYDIANRSRKGDYPFKAIVLDSLTTLAVFSLNQVLSNAGRLSKKPQIQDWGLAFIEIKQLLAVLRSVPVPKIVIGHDMLKDMNAHDDDKEDSDWRVLVALPGVNLATEVSSVFDEVWYMRARAAAGGTRKYIIQTLGSDKLDCRSRYCLPNMTDTKCGMWKLLEKCRKEEPAMT